MASPSPSPEHGRPPTGIERLWGTSVGGDMAFLLARANARSVAGANRALAGYELKVRSYSVLSLVADGARPTQRELSEFLRLDPSQIVALVDDLESRALARRESDPNDRRANVVVATAAGRETHRLARAAVQAAEAESFGALDPDEREQLTALLRGIAEDPVAVDAG
ncbi:MULTISPECIES: MarR family winged helix-turn-helix transcriptional regulator [unclassified Microbacterium]|uniref:MarR family winged helix-turn-helix transcriptional regulator n=1 Tax=unclassified Microbacterium TaxID=2609290 RepID=UPI00214B6C89|nr:MULTISPECIES: MarR family winged helix-turn-helix transcriptional regulator [unclassified Microbacterium]MCR2800259.1 MarR family winged helix-turn-helix transcriptional regulator [Microbacterium sp. zg.Y818]MCR2824350.1 MarR family winged helix-turn-helix transcriptional regulator [Microbacterium sp. zg.Y909]WIM22222.1 MarR family winged helix-turn-helix transcriptional regulator [Microbacterium sp. zg-Y818]